MRRFWQTVSASHTTASQMLPSWNRRSSDFSPQKVRKSWACKGHWPSQVRDTGHHWDWPNHFHNHQPAPQPSTITAQQQLCYTPLSISSATLTSGRSACGPFSSTLAANSGTNRSPNVRGPTSLCFGGSVSIGHCGKMGNMNQKEK